MLKACPRCETDLPLREFGVCRARKDGLNLYCKRCIRQKIARTRQNRREYLQAHGIQVVSRKTCKRAVSIRRLVPRERVRVAFERGLSDRGEIRRLTKLSWDELTDTIAELAVQGAIRWNRDKQIYVAA